MKTRLMHVFAVLFTAHFAFGQAAVEAARRQDPTGSGTFHRAGMLREQENARTAQARAGKPEAPPEKPRNQFFLWRWFSAVFGRSQAPFPSPHPVQP